MWRGLRFLSTRKHCVKISADLKDKTCWQRGPFVSCIGGQRSEVVSCYPTGGLSHQQWRTGYNGGCKLCGSGCVRLSAGLSCGWRDCRTGGTRSRAGGPPQFGNCLLTSGGLGPTGWDFQTGASLLFYWCVCVVVGGNSPVSPFGAGTRWPSRFHCTPSLSCLAFSRYEINSKICPCERQRM